MSRLIHGALLALVSLSLIPIPAGAQDCKPVVGHFGGVPTILFFTGRSTVFLKRGGEIVGTDTGSIDLPLRGAFNAAEPTTIGDYMGQLCR